MAIIRIRILDAEHVEVNGRVYNVSSVKGAAPPSIRPDKQEPVVEVA